MMHTVIPLITALGSLVNAIQITNPVDNSTYAAGSTVTVEWTSVDTDPTNFSLYLWNFVSWPPSYVALAMDVLTSDLSYSVQIPCDTNPEWGYQISGINGTNVYIIYAQGEKFNVSPPIEIAACVDFAPSLTVSTCPSAAASTVYATVSPTGPSSRHFHHHSSHVNPSPFPSIASTSPTVKPGIVPKTIGWCSDYSHPVTLATVPTPTSSELVANNGDRHDASSTITTAPAQVTDASSPRAKTLTTIITKVVCPAYM
jgi:hypothetical protein